MNIENIWFGFRKSEHNQDTMAYELILSAIDRARRDGKTFLDGFPTPSQTTCQRLSMDGYRVYRNKQPNLINISW